MARTALLPVELTDADRLDIQRDLSGVIVSLETVEAEKREEVREYNGTIKGYKKKIKELNDSLVSGRIQREVEVEERSDFIRGVVETYRLDRQPPEVVATRQIDPDERQVGLGLDGPTVGGETADLTEEQTAETPEEAESLREERLAVERSERVLDQVKAALEGVTFAANPEPRNPGEAVLASVQVLDDKVQIQASGPDEAAARAALDEMLVAYFSEAEQEIAKLAREQAADAAKDGPKHRLKRPKKGPKPRSHKSSAGASEEPEVPAGDPEVPPTDGEGKPLAF
jgi:hypothetical protein